MNNHYETTKANNDEWLRRARMGDHNPKVSIQCGLEILADIACSLSTLADVGEFIVEDLQYKESLRSLS